MYGTHLWTEYSKTGYDRIRITFKRGDSVSTVSVNAHMANFNMLGRKSVYNFIVRLSKGTNNAVITSILQSVYFGHGSRLLVVNGKTLY